MKINKHLLAAVAALTLAGAGTQASAYSISGTGDTGVTFTGMIDYNPAATLGELTISLTNTTDASIGGFITAYALNVSDTFSLSLVSTTLASFATVTMSESVSPFGSRDYAVSTGGSWLGGGSPNGGVAAGSTATWVFNVSPNDSDPLASDFLVRFRGLTDGGSDKVPVMTPIPEPSTYALMLAGLGVIGFMARRRRVD